MSQPVISLSEARQLMEESNGKIFTVMFIKKDGSFREMNARLGVSIGVNGRGRPFDPKNYDLLGVYDMQIHAHRMINLRSVQGLNYQGKNYKVRV